jgi:hypothetical protein
LREKDDLEELGVSGNIVLKFIVTGLGRLDWIDEDK